MARPDEARRPKVLLVEDEAVIAMDLEQWLTELGCEVVGPFKRTCDALRALGQGMVDFAVLDYLLGEENSGGVAERLKLMRVPFLFLTGCRELLWGDTHRDAPKLEKPVSQRQMREAIEGLCAPLWPSARRG